VASVVNTYASRLMELAFEFDQLDLVVETARRAGRVIDDPVAEIPMRRLHLEYADASGDPDLLSADVSPLARANASTHRRGPRGARMLTRRRRVNTPARRRATRRG